MKEYIKRMQAEKEELEGRIKRADKAIQNPPYNADEKSIELLKQQVEYMRGYSDILHQRLEYEVNK
jgi:tRNA1(Val) A37 N6-methylase TrmN6